MLKITFPTGTEVAVNIQYIGANTFMNVEIRASETDFNMTEGLCGTLNDQCVDDLAETDGKFSPVKCNPNEILNTIPQQFSDSWRFVKKIESILYMFLFIYHNILSNVA